MIEPENIMEMTWRSPNKTTNLFFETCWTEPSRIVQLNQKSGLDLIDWTRFITKRPDWTVKQSKPDSSIRPNQTQPDQTYIWFDLTVQQVQTVTDRINVDSWWWISNIPNQTSQFYSMVQSSLLVFCPPICRYNKASDNTIPHQ